jgi:hypothetical protein
VKLPAAPLKRDLHFVPTRRPSRAAGEPLQSAPSISLTRPFYGVTRRPP